MADKIDWRAPLGNANLAWEAVFSADREKAAEALIWLLRSEVPIPREARDRLADLFDSKASSRLFAGLKERRRGNVPRTPQQCFEVNEFVSALVWKGEKKEAAVASACAHFGLKRSAVFKILEQWEKAPLMWLS